jgi:hypothetical protein
LPGKFGFGVVFILFNEVSIMINLIENASLADSAWSIIEDEDSEWGMFQQGNRRVSGVAEVRYRIIKTLEHEGLPSDAQLIHKVFNISDVEGLWFLRTDIMQDLSLRYGEEEARIILGEITPLFEGLVPESMFRPNYVRFQQSGH